MKNESNYIMDYYYPMSDKDSKIFDLTLFKKVSDEYSAVKTTSKNKSKIASVNNIIDSYDEVIYENLNKYCTRFIKEEVTRDYVKVNTALSFLPNEIGEMYEAYIRMKDKLFSAKKMSVSSYLRIFENLQLTILIEAKNYTELTNRLNAISTSIEL